MNVWVLFGAAKEEAEEFGKGLAALTQKQKLDRKEEDYSLPLKSESAFNSNILGM